MRSGLANANLKEIYFPRLFLIRAKPSSASLQQQGYQSVPNGLSNTAFPTWLLKTTPLLASTPRFLIKISAVLWNLLLKILWVSHKCNNVLETML